MQSKPTMQATSKFIIFRPVLFQHKTNLNNIKLSFNLSREREKRKRKAYSRLRFEERDIKQHINTVRKGGRDIKKNNTN